MNDKNKPNNENNSTNLVMDTTNYLSKEEYYKTSITANINTILTKYHNLIVDCLKYSVENITKLKRKQLDFVLMRCYDTITHVFLNILLYTKNLDIVLLYCQKSCYFYVEFVNQITDEQNNFLQLGSKDACIYVYKKIFLDINMEYYKNAKKNGDNNNNLNNDNHIYFVVTEYTKLCKAILLHLNSCIAVEPIHNAELFKQLDEIIYYYIKLDNSQIDLYMNWICIVNDFFNIRVTKNNFTNISNTYLHIFLLFIKQLDKKGKDIEQYVQKINSNETKEKIIELFDNINININNNINVVNIQPLNEFVKWFFYEI